MLYPSCLGKLDILNMIRLKRIGLSESPCLTFFFFISMNPVIWLFLSLALLLVILLFLLFGR